MNERRPSTPGPAGPRDEPQDASSDEDTTGHISLAGGFGMPLELERRRQAERSARDLGRLIWRRRQAPTERIHERPPRLTEARR